MTNTIIAEEGSEIESDVQENIFDGIARQGLFEEGIFPKCK